MGSEGRLCHLDMSRECAESCTAFNRKSRGCRILEQGAALSKAVSALSKALGKTPPPKI